MDYLTAIDELADHFNGLFDGELGSCKTVVDALVYVSKMEDVDPVMTLVLQTAAGCLHSLVCDIETHQGFIDGVFENVRAELGIPG